MPQAEEDKITKIIATDGCRAIGSVVTAHQDVEAELPLLHAGLSRCRVVDSWLSMYHLSAKAKREIILSLAYNYLSPDDMSKKDPSSPYEKLLKLMRRHKTLTQARNYVVHGQWSFEEGAPVRMFIPSDGERIDLLVGIPGESKSKSVRDKCTFSIKDMEQVAYEFVELKKQIKEFVGSYFPRVYAENSLPKTATKTEQQSSEQ